MPEAMTGLMATLEHSGLGDAARQTTWLYPIANLIHVLGAALLVGAIAAFDVQVLRRLPEAAAISRTAIPLAALGLALQLPTGIVLLSAEATATVRNPAFQFKMAMLVIGLINVAVFHWRFDRRLKARLSLDAARPLAAVSLASWIVVLLAGRAIAYL